MKNGEPEEALDRHKNIPRDPRLAIRVVSKRFGLLSAHLVKKKMKEKKKRSDGQFLTSWTE